jgi:lambda repressor-like predicted transcriptional regulator
MCTSIRTLFTREMLEDAQKRVNNHGSMRSISRHKGIPQSTLRKRLKNTTKKHVE